MGIPINTLSTETRVLLRQQLDGKLGSLRDQRASWWAAWGPLSRLYLPRRYRWLVSPNQMNRGSAQNQEMIDETGMIAARTCSAGMFSGMCSPLRPWFKLKIAVPGFENSKPVAVWLKQVEDQLYRVFDASNFYASMSTLYNDLAVFGSASMLIYEDYENIINCQNPCLGEFFFGIDKNLRVSEHYREFVYTVSQTVDEFGLENVSEQTRLAYRQGGAYRTKEVVICHAIEPNSELYVNGSSTLMKVVPAKFAWREVYWEQAAQQTGDFLRISGIEEQCFIGARWDVVSNDAYGRCPGMDGYPAVSQLQIEQKRKAEAIDKSVRPPMQADISMQNQPSSITPGSITFVTNPNSTIGYKPAFQIDVNGLRYMIEDIKEVQNRVKEIFFVDLFLMIASLETVRTATEIDARREEKLIQLGPVVGRSQIEVHDVAINRTLSIMQRHPGVLPVPPPEIAGLPIKIEYVSMLAEAQRAVSAANIERALAFAGNLMGVSPTIGDNVDWDAAYRDYVDRVGASPVILTAIKEMIAVRQARAQKEQQMESAQAGMAAVQGAALLAKSGLMGQQPGGGAPA